MDLKLHHKKQVYFREVEKSSREGCSLDTQGPTRTRPLTPSFCVKNICFYILQEAHGNVNECNYTCYRLACGIKRKVFDQNQVIVITTCDLRASIENPRFGTWEDSILQPSHQGSFCLMHFICFDEKMMWRMAGFEESLVSPAKLDQNEMGGRQCIMSMNMLLFII